MTEYYTGGGDNGNTGLSHAQRWATMQYAWDNTSPGNHRINAYSGHTFTESGMTFTGHGDGDDDNRTTVEGYTSTAGDGGVATWDGSGSQIVNDITQNHFIWRNLRWINWGGNPALVLNDEHDFYFCEWDGQGARDQAVDVDGLCLFEGCRFKDFVGGTSGILRHTTDCVIIRNWIDSEDNSSYSIGIQGSSSASSFVIGNHISFKGTAQHRGIQLGGDASVAIGNSIHSNGASTGKGIYVSSANSEVNIVLDNIVGGFSGTGGTGMEVISGGGMKYYGNNKFYDNAADETLTGQVDYNAGGNENIGSHPYVSMGNTDPDDDDWRLARAVNIERQLLGSSNNQNKSVYSAGGTQRRIHQLRRLYSGLIGR